MLEYLTLKNWQSHKDTHMEFHPGINVIVGQNNAGKTAIVRALWTLVFNPLGYLKKFKRFSTKKWPSIEIGWKGHVITRTRDGYVLDDREPYQAVKDIVPTPIKQILNLTELNFKTIREDLFFVSMAPGARAKLLNKITGIDMQEHFVGHCKKQIAATSNNIKTQEHLRTQYRKEISALTPVLLLEPSIDTIGEVLDELVVTETTFNSIAGAYNSILELEAAIGRKEDVEKFRYLLSEAADMYSERSKLEKAIGEYKSTLVELQQLEKVSGRKKKVSDFRDLVIKAEDALQKAIAVGATVSHLQTALDKVVETQNLIDTTKTKIRDLERQKKKLLKDMGICPLCESKIED